MVEEQNLEILSTAFKYLTINQVVVLLLHLLITIALVMALKRGNQDRTHVVTALSPEQIHQLERNFATKYEQTQKETKAAMLDMLSILETHRRLLETNYSLQRAAADHSLTILEGGVSHVHSTGPSDWYDHVKNSMCRSNPKPPRPPAPIDPHTTYYTDNRLPTGEGSPAVLPVTSSATAQFQQKVT